MNAVGESTASMAAADTIKRMELWSNLREFIVPRIPGAVLVAVFDRSLLVPYSVFVLTGAALSTFSGPLSPLAPFAMVVPFAATWLYAGLRPALYAGIAAFASFLAYRTWKYMTW